MCRSVRFQLGTVEYVYKFALSRGFSRNFLIAAAGVLNLATTPKPNQYWKVLFEKHLRQEMFLQASPGRDCLGTACQQTWTFWRREKDRVVVSCWSLTRAGGQLGSL